MAPKRPTPIEEPPTALSSEEEVSEEEQPQKKAKSSTSESKVPSSSDDDSGSGSESESDSDQPPPIVVKPISSKPMVDPPKLKKPRSNPAKPITKRPVDEDIVAADAKDSKRAKKKKGVEVEVEASKSPVNDSKKKALFERIFQPEHEVTILSGMLDYLSKIGNDPVADIDGFYQYIKKKLVHVDFNRVQLLDKMKRMRKKYENNERKGKKGADRIFSKPVAQESYYLSKNLWGKEGINLKGGVKVADHAKSNGKPKNTPNNQMTPAVKDESRASIHAPIEEEPEKREVVKLNSGPSNSIWINKSLASSGLDESFVKEGLGLIDGAKKSDLEEKWRKLLLDEAEIYLRRIALVREQTELVLDAYKKQ